MLVDYPRERQLLVDLSSLQRLAYLLATLFWADLQAHHPGIDSLTLPRDVAAARKQRALTAVQAFCFDIAELADDDPVRWGPWAVRCPVSASDTSHEKDRSQRKLRMDARTRERLPVLPALVSWLAAERTGAGRR